MRLPIVAIVGRPNVGKSTLFNRIVGGRGAIVQDMPGVTRDRHYAEAEVLDRRLVVIDTGGFDPEADEGMLPAMRVQAEIAMEEADCVIAMYDAREGMLSTDEAIARILERSGKPVLHVVNKVDGPRQEPLTAEFWSMGIKELYGVSAQHGQGVYELLEALVAALPDLGDEEYDGAGTTLSRVAVIGRPNVGKSTLVNRLLGEERLLVSDVPGTTVDSIDTWLVRPPDPKLEERLRELVVEREEALEAARLRVAEGLRAFRAEVAEADEAAGDTLDESDESDDDDGAVVEWVVGEEVFEDEDEEELGEDDPRNADIDIEDARWRAPEDLAQLEEALREAQALLDGARAEQRYLMIDTAGVRRRKWVKTVVERISIVRSFKSIDRAEVCLLLLDGTVGVTDQDAKLAGLIQDKGRACVILVNKWDAVANKDNSTVGNYVKELRHDLQFVSYAPVVFISGLTGQRTHRILSAVDQVKVEYRRRVGTASLNRWLAGVVRRHQPPVSKNRRLRIYYISQVATGPPTFLLSVNDKKLLHFSYRRFLMNQLREHFSFEGTPLRLIVRGRDKKKRGRR